MRGWFGILRWAMRSVGSAMRTVLLVRGALWAFLFVQADVIVDWVATREILSGVPASTAGAFLAAMTLVAAWSERRVVADLVLGPRHALLRRQPAPPAAYGPAATLALAALAAPFGAFAVVWYGPQPAMVALWLVLPLGPMLLVGAQQPIPAAAGALLAGVLAAGAHAWPLLAPLILVALAPITVAGLGHGALKLPEDVPRAGLAGLRVGRPRTAVTALFLRDLLALWRREPRVLWTSAGLGAAVAFVVGATRLNNAGDRPRVLTTALITLAAAGPVTLAGLGAVARWLRHRLDPPEWPISALQRALALSLVAAALWTPSWAAAAVAGAPALGPAAHLQLLGLGAAIAASAAAFVSLKPARPDHSLFWWWLAACLGLALLAHPLSFVTLALVPALALALATRFLGRRRESP